MSHLELEFTPSKGKDVAVISVGNGDGTILTVNVSVSDGLDDDIKITVRLGGFVAKTDNGKLPIVNVWVANLLDVPAHVPVTRGVGDIEADAVGDGDVGSRKTGPHTASVSQHSS